MSTLLNLKTQLEEIVAFRKTRAYSSYVATIDVDLEGCEQTILATTPDSEANIAFLLQQYGRRTQLQVDKTFFEVAQSNLEDQILLMEDEESKATDNTETNNDN